MTALNRAGWRPEMTAGGADDNVTFTGNRALMLEEPLIFEIGSNATTGVDFDETAPSGNLGALARTAPIGLPGLSESETVRHYTRLSRQNYAIDLGLFPLGSCTMKHNPRLNEKVARLPGFADAHPLQPQETVQGAYAVIHELAEWLVTLTGMHSVAMSASSGTRLTPAGAFIQFSFICSISERILARCASSGAQKLMARPLFPARAVRPIRCT